MNELKQYKKAGNLFNDYRYIDEDFAVTCDYDFLKNLSVGDCLTLSEEVDSPWVLSIEFDDLNWSSKLLKVTRKIYSPSTLDVYVVEVDDDDNIIYPNITPNMIPIEELDISLRCITLLKQLNIKYLNQLSNYSKEDLYKIKNFGKRSIQELDEFMYENGLSWKS